MQEIKSFLFNSLTVSVGLIIYTLFLYLSYLMFFKEHDAPDSSDSSTFKDVEKNENKNEKLENYDILEDID